MASSRDRLVAATKDLVWRRGIAATSPAAILGHSGVGHGSLYHHFDGKPAVVGTAIQSMAADLQAGTDALLTDESLTAVERIRAYLTGPRDARRGCRLGRLAFDPGLTAAMSAPIAAYFTELQAALAGLISTAQSAGDLSASPHATDLAATITATIQGGYTLAAATGDAAALDRAAAGLLALFSPPRRKGRRTAA